MEEHPGQETAFGFKIKAKLHEEKTPYQKIEIYETESFGYLMAIDGFTMLTSRDNFLYHEMMSHPAIFTHPHPKNVVIIGGGDCGTLREVLKHQDIESVWQIDIDERVTRLSEQYFPELCEANNDPRAHFYFGDGVQWVKDARAESVDIVIVDSTDPLGPGEGLFTHAFYEECRRILRKNGLIIHQSESPLFHLDAIIKPMHRNMKKAGFTDVVTLQFPQPCYPSGWWTATMAIKNGDISVFREAEAASRKFTTKYYNENIHKASRALPTMMENLS
ncbi:MAG: polyamine aminopropyltransferase [Gammaproteobacteria bacterium]|nr:polyamine aminopropyltransferase [Gammaproteobacteria bacterium]MCD8542030.1 polyamine aminopropyltransferase [Gammaproteobacteria bacterium]MCD8573745.1 polyamine aminopropyltransferase [Gammaproteobacteria bacterium]